MSDCSKNLKCVFLTVFLSFFPLYAFSEECRLQTEDTPANATFTITCPNLAPETQQILNVSFQQIQTQLNTPLTLKRIQKDNAKDWVARYNKTVKVLENLKQDNANSAETLAKIEAFLKQGKFSEIIALLESLKVKADEKRKQNAQVSFFSGQIYLLDNKPIQALSELKIAYHDDAENLDYAIEYADLLLERGTDEEAIQIHQLLLAKLQQLSGESHKEKQNDLLKIKENLASLYANSEEQEELTASEKLYQEILMHYQESIKTDPESCLCEVAKTLGNIAILLSSIPKRQKEAEQKFQESLATYRDLAKTNLELYRSNVALTLNNLAAFIGSKPKRIAEAEQYYQESLDIYRDLVKTDAAYKTDVADTLFSLGLLISKDFDRKEESEKHYQEAVSYYKDLAKINPDYHGYVADTFFNLALLIDKNTSRRKDAEQYYQEALRLYQDSAKKNAVYRAYVADSFFRLAQLIAKDATRKEEAKQHYQAALTIFRALEEDNHGLYQAIIRKTLKRLDTLNANNSVWESPFKRFFSNF